MYMEKNSFDFTYTYQKTFGLKSKKIKPPQKLNFDDFTKNTSIATSTMVLKKKATKNMYFTETAICEDYFFKCKILKKIKHAYCLKNYLTKYRVRQGSLQSSKIKNFFWIWKINYKYNKFNFFENLKSLLFISFNSIKKYGFKYHTLLMGKPRGGNYHWIDNHLVKATRYKGKFTDLVEKEVTIQVFDDGKNV